MLFGCADVAAQRARKAGGTAPAVRLLAAGAGAAARRPGRPGRRRAWRRACRLRARRAALVWLSGSGARMREAQQRQARAAGGLRRPGRAARAPRPQAAGGARGGCGACAAQPRQVMEPWPVYTSRGGRRRVEVESLMMRSQVKLYCACGMVSSASCACIGEGALCVWNIVGRQAGSRHAAPQHAELYA